MKKSNDLRRGRTCVFQIDVHLVFVTKYRRTVFTKQILKDLKQIFIGICQDFETELIKMNGEKDHVHLLLNYPPKVSILMAPPHDPKAPPKVKPYTRVSKENNNPILIETKE